MAKSRSVAFGSHHYHIAKLPGYLGESLDSFGGNAVIVGDENQGFHFVGRVMFFPWKKLAG